MAAGFDYARAARNTKLLIILGSLGTLFFLGLEARREHFSGEWRGYQKAYLDHLPPAYRGTFEVGLKQSFLPDLSRVDRCQSCHAGIENPAMAGKEQPLAAHSGQHLKNHPPEEFGCTICHQGQGRATWLPDAHGEVAHWERPLLRGAAVYTSCGRCHVENTPFGPGVAIAAADLARNIPGSGALEKRGKRLFTSSGCLGCHKYQGRGGVLGPDLTHVGSKDLHGFDYTHLPAGTEHTPQAWLKAHFLDPGAVSPGTVMPEMARSAADAEALAAYMLSLKRPDVPDRYRKAPPGGSGRPAGGGELYRLFCIACHGPDLAGGQVEEIRTPSISNPDFLSVASDDYLRDMIRRGRSGTHMLAWSRDKGGLSEQQIERLVGYIRSFEAEGPDLGAISSARGEARYGRALFRGNCATCHGKKGEGGVGTRVGSPDFLKIASDAFLARVIVEGRPNTGMPSWRHLSAQQVSDILAFLRGFEGTGAPIPEVLARLAAKRADKQIGKKLFRSNCADCHGKKGEGIIGPSLDNADFLGIVSDEYLAYAIRDGRPGTAMPTWKHLSVEDLVDLVAHVRSLNHEAAYEEPQAPQSQGDSESGRLLFARACASCHGQEGCGGSGPQLANPVFLTHASEGYLYRTISRGRAGTPMRGFLKSQRGRRGAAGIADFSPPQIADLVAYLRSLRFQPIDRIARPVLGNAVRGKKIFEVTGGCIRCHDETGAGGIGTALGNPHFLRQATEGFVIGTMIVGRTGTQMRKFGSGGITKLTPEEIMDVTAYVRTLPFKRPSGPRGWRKFLPAGQKGMAEQLFRQNCAACHGAGGNGGYAPSLNNPEFLQTASDGFLVATIARGRQGTPMRAFGPGTAGLSVLTAEEVLTVVGLIRSWQHAGETAGQEQTANGDPTDDTNPQNSK